MKICIVYGTYSGGTLEVANKLGKLILEKGHAVDIQNIIDTSSSDRYELQFDTILEKIQSCNLVIIGSCTWFENDQEGQMHSGFKAFENKLGDKLFESKKFAIYGLGDSNYVHFCRAVDQLEKMVTDRRGEIVVPSLRIDRYHTGSKHEDEIQQWTEKLLTVLEG